MNRNQEYDALRLELERTPPGLAGTVPKVLTRKKHLQKMRRAFGVPAAGLASCFAAFVLLVNLSVPFARACGSVPVLRELAKAVAWSPSLSAAVENEYVQPMGQSQTVNGVTATVEYVIVDMKQLNVYYTLDSRTYPQLEAAADVYLPGERGGYATSSGSFDAPNGELRSVRLDFIERDIPENLELELRVYAKQSSEEPAAPAEKEPVEYDPFTVIQCKEPEYLAVFTFPLELDPTFTAKGETFPVNADFILDGRAVSITEAEVYPTHMRLNLHTDPANDAWLTGLEFYMEDEAGHRFRPNTNGILSTGMTGGSDDSTIWLDSPYFNRGRRLTLHITGADWLDKEAPRVRLDLAEGTAENLPEDVRFWKAEKLRGGWLLSFLAPVRGNTMYAVFGRTFWDEEGREYEASWSAGNYGYEDPETGAYVEDATVFTDEYPLEGFEGDVVYLEPLFHHVSTCEIPIAIAIPIR